MFVNKKMDILLIIAVVWLIAATITDIKKREVANWLSFSLITIALITRAAESIIAWDLGPLTTSITGLGIFFIIANVLYYGKIFAGGDAKLLIALGAIIPSLALLSNILVIGGIYGLIYSTGLAITNSKDFLKEVKKINKVPGYMLISILFLFMIGLTFQFILLYFLAAAALLLYGLHVFIKAVETSCMIQAVSPKKLTEGDWLYKNVKVGRKTIKVNFQGLTMKEILLLRRSKKKVQIKYGIPFIPVFLIAFLLTIFLDNLFFLLL